MEYGNLINNSCCNISDKMWYLPLFALARFIHSILVVIVTDTNTCNFIFNYYYCKISWLISEVWYLCLNISSNSTKNIFAIILSNSCTWYLCNTYHSSISRATNYLWNTVYLFHLGNFRKKNKAYFENDSTYLPFSSRRGHNQLKGCRHLNNTKRLLANRGF